MKTQTQILDNRLYYTRKIQLHRKGKKSRTVRITPIMISRYRDTFGQIRAADNAAGRSATQHLERCRPILICGIWWLPHPMDMCGTRPFYGGSEARAVAHTRPAFPKMPTAPTAFPLLGAPQAPGDEPNTPEGGKRLGKAPLKPKEISRYRDTRPDPCRR